MGRGVHFPSPISPLSAPLLIARLAQLNSPTVTMPAYELRSGGDVKNKKQSVADLKYRRLTELNARLKEDLDRPRVKVSEAALS